MVKFKAAADAGDTQQPQATQQQRVKILLLLLHGVAPRARSTARHVTRIEKIKAIVDIGDTQRPQATQQQRVKILLLLLYGVIPCARFTSRHAALPGCGEVAGNECSKDKGCRRCRQHATTTGHATGKQHGVKSKERVGNS